MARLFNDASSQGLYVSSAAVTAVPFTMALWINTDDVTINPVMMSLVNASDDQKYFSLEFRGAEAGDYVAAVARESTRYQTNSTAGLTANTWHHVCGVFASTTSRTIYLDGGNSATGTDSITPTGINRTSVGYLARYSPVAYFSGMLAEAAIWNDALTSSEVMSLAKGFSPLQIRPTALVNYWPLYGRHATEPDVIGASGMTLLNSPTKAEHPRIILPRKRRFYRSAAGGGGIAGPLIGGRLTQSILTKGKLVG